jgi:hypothetical protein
MDQSIKGRCLCGAVTIELTPPTELCAHCHCESCRRAHAAAFVTWTAVADRRFQVTRGEELVTRHESSPGTFRCFCRCCGTAVFCYYTAANREFASSAGQTYVPVAVLDDPLDRQPTAHVSFEEKVPWLDVADALPRFRAKTDVKCEALQLVSALTKPDRPHQ